MRDPLIVAEGRDVQIFKSKRDAELYLEAVDVADGVYRGFDADGRPLKFSVDGTAVHISTDEALTKQIDELREVLSDFLATVTGQADTRTRHLDELIETSRPFWYVPPTSAWEVVRGLFRRPRKPQM